MGKAPEIAGMLETGVCVDDLALSSRFYKEVLGLKSVLEVDRLHAFALAPGEVLLLFDRALAQYDADSEIGCVPGHRTDGPAHFCFRIAAADYDAWKKHLREQDVAVTSEVAWPAGGRSFYFRDPEGNVLEMASPGLWANYPKDFQETKSNE